MKNNLRSVQEHLKDAPGSFLSRLRSKFTKRTGLVQNSKIHDELLDEILNPERLKSWMDKREEWEIYALSLIFASAGRGLHFLELERNFDVEQKALKAFLSEAASEMFIWRAKCQNSYAYYGFADYESTFLNILLKNDEKPETAIWFSNEGKAELYLLSILAKIQLRKISVKKDYSLSRRSKKQIDDVFSKSSSLDNSVATDCVRILFSFLVSKEWVAKNLDNSELVLQPPALAFLQKTGIRLFSELTHWWQKERFQGEDNLKKLLKYFEKPMNAFNAAQLFWPYDACSRLIKNKSVTWASLPLPLRELWILGILKMQKKKNILAFEISEYGKSFFFTKQPPKEGLSEPIVSNSSNFEWLLSQSNCAYRVFQMLSFAELKNEEEPLRFALNKESFLDGLRSGLPAYCVKDFLSWNKAVPNVAVALNEWLCIYNDSSIETMCILRIKNQEKYKELSKHKPFQECIAETIPDWGFVIKPECEKKIREILSHFSLEPAYNIAAQHLEPLQKLVEIEGFNLPCPITNGKAEFE